MLFNSICTLINPHNIKKNWLKIEKYAAHRFAHYDIINVEEFLVSNSCSGFNLNHRRKSGKLTVLFNFLDIIVVAKVYNSYPYPIAIHE